MMYEFCDGLSYFNRKKQQPSNGTLHSGIVIDHSLTEEESKMELSKMELKPIAGEP